MIWDDPFEAFCKDVLSSEDSGRAMLAGYANYTPDRPFGQRLQRDLVGRPPICGSSELREMMETVENSSEWLVHPWVTQGAGRVRFGVMGGPLNDWPRLSAFVARVEEFGFDSYWTIDHPLRAADWATNLAALAVTTRSLRLGTLVACVYYRNPIVLARQAADVDRLSGGRFVLGLGIGHVEREFAQMGIPFPAPKARQAALAEVIRIVYGVWGAEPFSDAGEHFRVQGATVRPGPVQKPRVPLLIAGGGEQITLRQVARWADASNFGEDVGTGGAATLDEARRKLAALDRHLLAAGRATDSVLRTHITLPLILAPTSAAVREKVKAIPGPYLGMVGTPAEAIDYYRSRAEIGLRYFIVRLLEEDTETLQLLARHVVPHLDPQ